jgi:YidC/Oxa1 family membrane protein insertase
MFGFVEVFARIFGYVLSFLFDIFGNYGVSVIVFAALCNILMFPSMIKRQRHVTVNARYEMEKYFLRKYTKNPREFSEKLMALNERKGINPMKGTFNISFVLMIIMFSGIYGTVQRPLTNVLHLSREKVTAASEVLDDKSKSAELQIIKNFDNIKDKITMFSQEELEKISKFSCGFDFYGLDLLKVPKNSALQDMLWVLPLFSFAVCVASTYITQKISGTDNDLGGFGKIMMYSVCLFQAWITNTVAGAVGVYWIANSLLGILQMVIVSRYFSNYAIKAKEEAILFKKIVEEEEAFEEEKSKLLEN